MDDAIQPLDLVPCAHCARMFAADRLERHQTICQKSAAKKPRKQFDSLKQRIVDEEGAEYFARQAEKEKDDALCAARAAAEREKHRKRVLRESQQLRQAIKVGKLAASGDKEVDDTVDQVEPGDDGRVECKHCNRRFAPLTLERHITKCREIKAKPSTLKRGAGGGGAAQSPARPSTAPPATSTTTAARPQRGKSDYNSPYKQRPATPSPRGGTPSSLSAAIGTPRSRLAPPPPPIAPRPETPKRADSGLSRVASPRPPPPNSQAAAQPPTQQRKAAAAAAAATKQRRVSCIPPPRSVPSSPRLVGSSSGAGFTSTPRRQSTIASPAAAITTKGGGAQPRAPRPKRQALASQPKPQPKTRPQTQRAAATPTRRASCGPGRAASTAVLPGRPSVTTATAAATATTATAMAAVVPPSELPAANEPPRAESQSKLPFFRFNNKGNHASPAASTRPASAAAAPSPLPLSLVSIPSSASPQPQRPPPPSAPSAPPPAAEVVEMPPPTTPPREVSPPPRAAPQASPQAAAAAYGSPPPSLQRQGSSLEADAFGFNSPKPFRTMAMHEPPPPPPPLMLPTAAEANPNEPRCAAASRGWSADDATFGGSQENSENVPRPAANVVVASNTGRAAASGPSGGRFGWRRQSFVSRPDSPMLKMR